MNILIVDDNINKLSDVSKVLFESNIEIEVSTVEDIQGAMNILKTEIFDLLILDQHLPIRKGLNSEILEEGGVYLLNEITRKSKEIYPPRYIIGLSQFEKENVNFSDIWKLIEYSPSHNKWCKPLTKILYHINRISIYETKDVHLQEDIPVLFVEGLTDLNLLQYVTKIYFKDFESKFKIKSQKNAGANWVAQQLVIWGHKLQRNSNNELLKSVGLFDADGAGVKAKKDTINKLNTANQKSATKIHSLVAKYSEDLIQFYKKGVKIEIEIESLLPKELLKIADDNGWMENRNPLFLEKPKDFDQMSENLPEYLNRIGISKELCVYLKKVKMDKKEKFMQLVIKESDKSNSTIDNVKKLMDDLLVILLN